MAHLARRRERRVGITDLETMLANPPPYWAPFIEQEYLRVGDPRTEEGARS